jgi:hypothetical protein
MLDMAPRLRWFPPIPFLDPPPRRLRESERRLIMVALAAPPPALPTDWPDLTPLLECAPGGGERA